jgi:ERCC4-related helicase
MSFPLSPFIRLQNDRIDPPDALRQTATAAEICRRLESQPGLVLADDVGMGKTFVALAVAVSAVHADPSRQVVVMVPSAVAKKWPDDWNLFRDTCLNGGPEVRATNSTITRGSDFLKLLDDPPETRNHLIFLTHGALTSNLNDPFVKLAALRHAFLRQPQLQAQRDSFPRWASKVLNRPDFKPERVSALWATAPSQWRQTWNRVDIDEKQHLDDDPVPASVLSALSNVDLADLRLALERVPLRASSTLDARLRDLRGALNKPLADIWKQAVSQFDAQLPLLILDEAHHAKNPNQLRSLFDGGNAEAVGALGSVFERMMLLTATPFQLGHRELLQVLGIFRFAHLTDDERTSFNQTMAELGGQLDRSHAAANFLENSWTRLEADALAALTPEWWSSETDDLPDGVRAIAAAARAAQDQLDAAGAALRPWVIRHAKQRRRRYFAGAQVAPGCTADGSAGLPIENESVLPFLLAARAQAYVAEAGLAQHSRARAFFADGLASSFETYLQTRKEPAAESQDDVEPDSAAAPEGTDPRLEWYLGHIEEAVPKDGRAELLGHPKVSATVARAIELWGQGEKVLIFCFYRETGRALLRHISESLQHQIAQKVRLSIGRPDLDDEACLAHLGERADSILRTESRGGRLLTERVSKLAAEHGLGPDDAEQLSRMTLKFLRTSSYLVRYVDFEQRDTEAAVERTLSTPDGSGLALSQRLGSFADRIRGMTPDEQAKLWAALQSFRTGRRKVGGPEFAADGEDADAQEEPDGIMLLPNVHLANGNTRQDMRDRLMRSFNTPFLPEVLIASSVMAEGVDLHRDCRHVIHHDLDWNPSTLEQRTGRVDRIGSKALACRLDIEVYEPFVGGTQDEKQYRVVKDREKWFGVLMGGRMPQGEWETDRIADRAPLPEQLQAALTLDLSVYRP